MNTIKCFSHNAHGLSNQIKCRTLFRSMKKVNADIVFFQEVHGTKETNTLWNSEWGGKGIYANGDSNAQGVALLFSKAVGNRVRDVVRDVYGHYLICKLELEEGSYCIVNVYAPNQDRPKFFQEVFEQMRFLNCAFTIMGGDFNVVQNPKMDRSREVVYHPESLSVIQEFMDMENIIDI